MILQEVKDLKMVLNIKEKEWNEGKPERQKRLQAMERARREGGSSYF